jgi:nucleotide-binding universal stress UspA family protein
MEVRMKNILVARDLGKDSARVIRYALELGCKFHAQIHVLHVMPTVDASVMNMVSLAMGADKLAKFNKENEAELAEQTRKQLHELILEEAEYMEEEVAHPPKVEVHHGEPVPMILTIADNIDADLIVIGSHSKGRLEYAFLGSVAEKILRKSHRPVMIVPPNALKPSTKK